MDDGIIVVLAWAMPKLKTLQLGDQPCRETPTGVTAKGLVALAHYRQNIVMRSDCDLAELEAGRIYVPSESLLLIALTLARIFPRSSCIDSVDPDQGCSK